MLTKFWVSMCSIEFGFLFFPFTFNPCRVKTVVSHGICQILTSFWKFVVKVLLVSIFWWCGFCMHAEQNVCQRNKKFFFFFGFTWWCLAAWQQSLYKLWNAGINRVHVQKSNTMIDLNSIESQVLEPMSTVILLVES